jgi:hypothetical protein
MMSKLEEEFGKFEGFEYRTRKPLNKLVEGIGINDAPFVVAPTIINKRVTHPAYSTWISMLKRCYSDVYQKQKPTYKEVTCCEDWLLFTNFAKWFKNHYVIGYQLDKDILFKNNKLYSPETCIFVPREINQFTTISGATRGELPIGVSLHLRKFRAVVSNNSKQLHLGCFNTKEEAHREWQKAKLEQAVDFNFPPLQRIIDQLKFEIDNNLETTSL